MASKTRYVELPIYVVQIGLLYAFLLTSGLVLAWVIIYRHEQNIAELRQMLNTREDKHESQAVDTVVYTNTESDMLVQEDKEIDNMYNGPRERREQERRKIKRRCSKKCVGQKGEKGDKGKAGKKGESGSPGSQGFPGPRGYRGDRGDRGPKGDMGERGERGSDGHLGRTGGKGDKGETGRPGLNGLKGDRGQAGQTLMHNESAHIVGTGNIIESAPPPGDVYMITSWKKQHRSGNMKYHDGRLRINVDGVYFVYSQMFYFDRNNTYTGFNVYIDNKRILKAIYSIVDYHKPYHTQFISGVFKINKGQTIWVGTTIKRKYFFNESSAFFGAFMLHP